MVSRRNFFARATGFVAALFGALKAAAHPRLPVSAPRAGLEYFRINPSPINYDNKPLTREMAEMALRRIRNDRYWRGLPND